jgi:hypothetical protein
MNSDFRKLKNKQHQQLLKFTEKYGLDFPKESSCLFSMAQFVRNRLLDPIRPSITYNEHQIKDSYEEFLRRCLRKIGIFQIPEFINRGRSNPINPQDIIRFQSSTLLQDQIFAISHYGPVFFLGNISAIAEMCYRLSSLNLNNAMKEQLIQLIKYGISLGCRDCLGMMSYFMYIERGAEYKDVLKLAGQTAEAGSIYGWFALARLLKDNSDMASYHNEHDRIHVDEYNLGVRQFINPRIPLGEQIRRALKEYGCKLCQEHYKYSKEHQCPDCELCEEEQCPNCELCEEEQCPNCNFDFSIFNYFQDDDDKSIPILDQMQIAVKIYNKILSENPPSHPICVDTRRNLIKIYKEREWLFGGSVEATEEEIHRLEAI